MIGTPSSNSSDARSLLARTIDNHNPGVTMLVSIWAAGFALRAWLTQHGLLTQIADEALTSLLFVVPIMLVGWATMAVVDKRFKLGLFRSDDDR
jgi:hypothetical protein